MYNYLGRDSLLFLSLGGRAIYRGRKGSIVLAIILGLNLRGGSSNVVQVV